MKSELLKCAGFLIGLVFVFTLIPQSAAAVVWEDNFDDGNYDGWTIADGNWNVENGYLVADLTSKIRCEIWHPSSQVVGTWSFDVFAGPEGGFVDICFMQNGTESYTVSIRQSSDPVEAGIYFEVGSLALAHYELIGFEETWTHYDITRNSTGGFHVYLNATSSIEEPIIEVVNMVYSSSERLLLVNHNYDGSRFDNITVNDEILITPPEPTTPTPTTTSPTDTTPTTTTGGSTLPLDMTLLIAGAGVAVVVIVAAVVFMRRR